MVNEWFIPGSTPSLKNSKVKTPRGIFPSKTVKKYLASLGIQKYSVSKKEVVGYKTRPNLFIESLKGFPKFKEEDYPIILGFYFVRRTRANFDFNNANSLITDLLVAHNFIEDDSMKYLIPMPIQKDNTWYKVDKENPGVIIKLIEKL